jgi:3-dehydroquinate dehydratase-2
MRILVINGPNMNMLGIRERDKYGAKTLEDIYDEVRELAQELNVEVEFIQSNMEGDMINAIHGAFKRCDGIIINPAGYTYHSVAILDALLAVDIPAIEVHMTNIFARESFRKDSVTASGCIGVISGFGSRVYTLALRALYDALNLGR